VVASPTTRVRQGVAPSAGTPRTPSPLTRLSAFVQGVLRAASGSVCSATLASLWVLGQRGKLPAEVVLALPFGVAVALWAALRRRRHPEPGASLARLDFELASLGLLALLQGIVAAPHGLAGPLSGALYPAMALLCLFARPLASLASWGFLTSILLALPTARGLGALAPALLAALVGLTGFASWLAMRSLLDRARRAARQSVDRELNRLQDAARSLCPAIDPVLEQVAATGAAHTLVSGSGPTVFGYFHDPEDARAAAAQLPGAIAVEPLR